MSKLFNQLLMLSGFYFILSFVLSTWKSNVFYYLSLVLFGVLVVLIILLCWKKNFSFLEKFDNNSPKVSNYLKAVGVAQYFDIFFGMIPSMFVNTQPEVPVYFRYASMVYLLVLLVSLVYATYLNVRKKSDNGEVKKVSKKAPAKKATKK